MGKPINNHFELKSVCRTAGLWYVGSFMEELLREREQWENPETKTRFIEYMYREYGGADSDISGTRTRINAMIRIIESRKIRDALQLVLDANDAKLGCDQSKINAQNTLDKLNAGILIE